MLFWILVSVLTAAVAALLLSPLMRAAVPPSPRAHDVEVYRDQLDELKRDETGGLISGDEAQFARAEIARRLLAAADGAKQLKPIATGGGRNLFAQMAVILVLPAVGLGLYLTTGHPDLPDAPLAARLAAPENDLNILIARAEERLATRPQDGAGWEVLGPIYYRSGRFDDAAKAFRNAAQILGPTPARLGGYAESLIALAGGRVTPDAQTAFRTSLAIKPNDPRAQYYLALALKQEGKAPQALAAFQAIVRASPADAPWLPLVSEHIQSLGGDAATASNDLQPQIPGNPSSDDMAAADAMSAPDRTAMIEGMVASLAQKLDQDPQNFEGWMRIIRSYAVLGKSDEAASALKRGLAAFPASGDQGKQLLALGGQLGIDALRVAP